MPKRTPLLVLVEDDPADQDLFRIALESVGHDSDLEVFDSVDSALARLRQQVPAGPALVFTDLKMPGRNGTELVAELRADPALRHLAVLVLSTSQAQDDVRRAHWAGCNAYHIKPMGLHGFEKLLATILEYWGGESILPERSSA